MFGQKTLIDARVLTEEEFNRYADNPRKPVELDVTIYCHTYPFVTRRSRSLGPDGIFVETGPLAFPKNAYLEVEFELADERGTRLYRIPVYVGQRNRDGLDLLFVNTYDRAFSYLQDLKN